MSLLCVKKKLSKRSNEKYCFMYVNIYTCSECSNNIESAILNTKPKYEFCIVNIKEWIHFHNSILNYVKI